MLNCLKLNIQMIQLENNILNGSTMQIIDVRVLSDYSKANNNLIMLLFDPNV